MKLPLVEKECAGLGTGGATLEEILNFSRIRPAAETPGMLF
jgi:hypothetical protein